MFHPVRWLDDYLRPGRSLPLAAGIVLVTFMASALCLILGVAILAPGLPTPLPDLFFGLVVGWLLIGVLLHVAATVVAGDGRFRDALVVAAWGLPGTVAVWLAFLAIAVYYGFVAGAPTTVGPSVWPLYVGSGVGFTLAGYVWTIGLQGTHDLARRDAAVAAGGVVVVNLALAFLL